MAKKFSLKQSTGRARVFQVADSTNRIDITTNADYVGGVWIRDDVTKPAWHLALNEARFVVQYASAGANPISPWVDVISIPVADGVVTLPNIVTGSVTASGNVSTTGSVTASGVTASGNVSTTGRFEALPYFGEGGELYLADASGANGWVVDNVGSATLRFFRGLNVSLQMFQQTFGTVMELLAAGTAGGKSWWIESTGGDAIQGQGKLLFRNNSDSRDVLMLNPDGNVQVGSGASAISLSTTDAGAGMWLRNSGVDCVFSTHVGNLYIGFAGNTSKSIRLGNDGTQIIIAGNAPASSLVVASDGTVRIANNGAIRVVGGAPVDTILVNASGEILMVGGALHISGSAPPNSIQINSDGTISTAHATPFSPNSWTAITPQNSWTGTLRGRRTREGYLQMTCTLSGGTASALGTLLGTLPVGLRPTSAQVIPIAAVGGTVSDPDGRVTININGEIYLFGFSAAPSSIHFSTIIPVD
jgi:hypothetical protein